MGKITDKLIEESVYAIYNSYSNCSMFSDLVLEVVLQSVSSYKKEGPVGEAGPEMKVDMKVDMNISASRRLFSPYQLF